MVYMYADSDEEPTDTTKPQLPVFVKGYVTEVDIGTHKIKVIDPDYVVALERRVMMLEQQLQRQQQDLVRYRNDIDQRRRESMALQDQIDRKVDRS